MDETAFDRQWRRLHTQHGLDVPQPLRPVIAHRELNLLRFYAVVMLRGGHAEVGRRCDI